MRVLHLASSNGHKIAEIRELLAHEPLELVGAPSGFAVEEDAPNFAGNAAKKALALYDLCHARGHRESWVLADDSGLEVDALGGRPGVRSARFGEDEAARLGYASPAEQDLGCRQALLAALRKHRASQPTARLRCTLALVRGTRSDVRLFDGVIEGTIAPEARGHFGFGYDALFIPEGHHKTFGELGPAIKAQMSHRGRALAQLKKAWASLSQPF